MTEEKKIEKAGAALARYQSRLERLEKRVDDAEAQIKDVGEMIKVKIAELETELEGE